jgi:hypothetical protein
MWAVFLYPDLSAIRYPHLPSASQALAVDADLTGLLEPHTIRLLVPPRCCGCAFIQPSA